MQALDRMGAYLRGLASFSLRAEDAVEEVLDSGQTIQLTKTVEFQVRKPDRLHAAITTDRNWNHPVGTAVAIGATAAVIGSIIYSLPPSCSMVQVGGSAARPGISRAMPDPAFSIS